MLQHVSAITASLQDASTFLACAAYSSTYIAGILHMIEVIILKIQCYSSYDRFCNM
jgi:hypothetical protein